MKTKKSVGNPILLVPFTEALALPSTQNKQHEAHADIIIVQQALSIRISRKHLLLQYSPSLRNLRDFVNREQSVK